MLTELSSGTEAAARQLTANARILSSIVTHGLLSQRDQTISGIRPFISASGPDDMSQVAICGRDVNSGSDIAGALAGNNGRDNEVAVLSVIAERQGRGPVRTVSRVAFEDRLQHSLLALIPMSNVPAKTVMPSQLNERCIQSPIEPWQIGKILLPSLLYNAFADADLLPETDIPLEPVGNQAIYTSDRGTVSAPDYAGGVRATLAELESGIDPDELKEIRQDLRLEHWGGPRTPHRLPRLFMHGIRLATLEDVAERLA